MKMYMFKYMLVGVTILFIVFISMFSLIKDSVFAQESRPSAAFNTEYKNDPVFKNLKEFSTLPIKEEGITKGRVNPFTDFENE